MYPTPCASVIFWAWSQHGLRKDKSLFLYHLVAVSFLVLTDCNACFAIPLQLPGDVWGCLRITQHLNQLQFILQEVLLFWVREANLRGHSPFCQSENKIYATMLDLTADHRTEMAESFVFVLFCRFFFTVNYVTYCWHCNSLQVWCLCFFLLLTQQQMLWINLKAPPWTTESCSWESYPAFM